MADTTITGTIEYIEPEGRIWDNPKGGSVLFIDTHLSDGAVASVGCAPDKETEVRASLDAIKGVPSTLTVEQKDDYNGKRQFKLKDWPGKPAGSGGGGGGKGGSGGGMSHAQVGLLAASNIVAASAVASVDVAVAETIRIGEIFTEHLFTRRKGEQAETETTPATVTPIAAVPDPADTLTLAQMQRLMVLGQLRGHADAMAVAKSLAVESIGSLTKEEAAGIIEIWEAEANDAAK